MNRRMRAFGLVVAAAVALFAAWVGAAELPEPARLLTVALVVVLPVFLLAQAGMTQDDLRNARLESVYISSMILIWALGLIAVRVWTTSGFVLADLGLRPVEALPGLAWTIGITLAAIAVVFGAHRLGVRESPMLEWLLPRTQRQRVLFVLLSLSAGVGEELAFRGFLLPALRLASGSTVLAVIVSSLAFGMMHSYQSPTGALRAGLLGMLLTVPLLVTHSLYPSMAAHALFDLIAGLVLGEWLLRDHPPKH